MNILRIIALLFAMLIGSVPFLLSFGIGVAVKRWAIVLSLAWISTLALTLVAAFQPDSLSIGDWRMNLNNGFVFDSRPTATLIANALENLLFAWFGASAGWALRNEFVRARSAADHPLKSSTAASGSSRPD